MVGALVSVVFGVVGIIGPTGTEILFISLARQ
jgi:hypothetical protein